MSAEPDAHRRAGLCYTSPECARRDHVLGSSTARSRTSATYNRNDVALPNRAPDVAGQRTYR